MWHVCSVHKPFGPETFFKQSDKLKLKKLTTRVYEFITMAACIWSFYTIYKDHTYDKIIMY